jgi:hypothetical protein
MPNRSRLTRFTIGSPRLTRIAPLGDWGSVPLAPLDEEGTRCGEPSLVDAEDPAARQGAPRWAVEK